VKERHRNKELVSMRKTTEGLDGTVVWNSGWSTQGVLNKGLDIMKPGMLGRRFLASRLMARCYLWQCQVGHSSFLLAKLTLSTNLVHLQYLFSTQPFLTSSMNYPVLIHIFLSPKLFHSLLDDFSASFLLTSTALSHSILNIRLILLNCVSLCQVSCWYPISYLDAPSHSEPNPKF
jgi:hypothetical protein